MSEFKPGTVAVATVRGVEGVRVMRMSGGRKGWWAAAPPHSPVTEDNEVTDVRPLVVLDLDEAAPKGWKGSDFPNWLRGSALKDTVADGGLNLRPEFLRNLADQIEEQTKPPKPAEPKGIGAVVEDSGHRLWVRHDNTPGSFPWVRAGHGVAGWSEIAAVKVLSEGVTR